MGKGSSGIKAGKGNKAAVASGDWKKDYDDAIALSEKYRERAEAMDAEVKAARDAYYSAPDRSKAQKAEKERLEKTFNDLNMQQMMLRYRAAQLSSFADNLLSEKDPRAWRRKGKVDNTKWAKKRNGKK